MPVIRTVGSAEVIALEDGVGPFFKPREQMIPAATPEHWRRADALDPGVTTADGQWLLRFRCYLIRVAGRIVLVDTGIGPAGAPAAGWAPVPGRLPDELAAAGVTPDDVDTVVLSHLHTDHIGWAVVGSGTPYFRNATYVLQLTEDAAVMSINPELRERLLDPLDATRQLRLLDGVTPLGPGVTALHTPGHTPGHQSVLVSAADEAMLVTGDLLVHPVQLVAPELAYAYEMDPLAARESRTAQLRNLAGWPTATLATAHFSNTFVSLP